MRTHLGWSLRVVPPAASARRHSPPRRRFSMSGRRRYATPTTATQSSAGAHDPNLGRPAPVVAQSPQAHPSQLLSPQPTPYQPVLQQQPSQQSNQVSLSGPELIAARPGDPIPPPEIFRATTRMFPASEKLAKQVAVPLGAVLQPLTWQNGIEESIAVVDMGGVGIVRCRRCRSYINPWVRFLESGSRWQCNLCALINDVHTDYYVGLDAQGQRLDRFQRPELSQSVVEYVAPTEYMVRPPMPPIYLFAIDVSIHSVTSGFLHIIANTIQYVLEGFLNEGEDSRVRVGFITYDSKCHFYNLKPGSTAPQMMVVGVDKDESGPFLPGGYDLLVPLTDAKDAIFNLVQLLPTMFTNTKEGSTCMSGALLAAKKLMEPFGGKLFLFASCLPTIGPPSSLPDSSRLEKNRKLLGTTSETSLLTADEKGSVGNWYRTFALDCSKLQICVDLFLAPPAPTQAPAGTAPSHYGFMDVPTLSLLSEVTGGQVWYYEKFHALQHGSALSADLVAAMQRFTAWESVMRVRCSKGVQVSQTFGNFFIRSTDLLALPTCDAHKSFGLQFSIQADLLHVAPIPGLISVQAALLYTTSFGERRIRVITVGIPLSQDPLQIFNAVDGGAVTALMTKMATQKALSSSLQEARDAVVNKVVEIVASHEKSSARGGGVGQLLLPPTLHSLPAQCLALIKSVLLRSNTPELLPDLCGIALTRSHYLNMARTLPIELLLAFLYPRLLALHPLPEQAGYADENGVVTLSPSLNLSAEKLRRDGIFLLDNGITLIVWVAHQVDPVLLSTLFGVQNATEIDPYTAGDSLVYDENEAADSYKNRISLVINAVRAERPTYQPLIVLHEKHLAVQANFYDYLVEDRTRGVYSYHEFLQQVQKAVNKAIRG